jgi:hypothetical protein
MGEARSEGGAGLVLPPTDPDALRAKLVFIRLHPGEPAEMDRAGRRVRARFTWPEAVQRCLDACARPAGVAG